MGNTPRFTPFAVQKFLAGKLEKQLAISTDEMLKALSAEDRTTNDKLEQQIKVQPLFTIRWRVQ